MSEPRQREAITWPTDYYALIDEPGAGRDGDRLAVCVTHQGEHVRYICPDGESWCQALPPHRRGPRLSRLRGEPARSPARIEVTNTDEVGEAIGSGLVLGFRRARAEQRAERQR